MISAWHAIPGMLQCIFLQHWKCWTAFGPRSLSIAHYTRYSDLQHMLTQLAWCWWEMIQMMQELKRRINVIKAGATKPHPGTPKPPHKQPPSATKVWTCWDWSCWFRMIHQTNQDWVELGRTPCNAGRPNFYRFFYVQSISKLSSGRIVGYRSCKDYLDMTGPCIHVRETHKLDSSPFVTFAWNESHFVQAPASLVQIFQYSFSVSALSHKLSLLCSSVASSYCCLCI